MIVLLLVIIAIQTVILSFQLDKINNTLKKK